MSEKLLEISGLSVCYEGEQILNNICFSVEKGETVGIAGESGSGKSTLLRAILRLMGKNGSITGGQITFCGEELTGMSEKKLRSLCGSEIGMIFQNTGASLCPTRKIGAQICESVRAHEKRCGFITPISGGMSGRKSRREIKDMTLQRFADIAGIFGSRYDDIAGSVCLLTEFGQAFFPIHIRHIQIQNYQIDFLLIIKNFQCLGKISSLKNDGLRLNFFQSQTKAVTK